MSLDRAFSMAKASQQQGSSQAYRWATLVQCADVPGQEAVLNGRAWSAGVQQAAPWCVAMISGWSSFRMPRRRLYSPAARGKPQGSDQRFESPHTEVPALLLSYCVTHNCPPMITVQGAVHQSAYAFGVERSKAPAGLRWSLSGSLNLASWSSWCRATVCLLVRFCGGMSSSTPPRISAISRPALHDPAILIMPLEDLERASADLGIQPSGGITLRSPTVAATITCLHFDSGS